MNKKSFTKYFQYEINKLQNLAKEFSLEHPAVAPMLSTHNADPDAERLLEGVAFLTALLNQKLDNEFPEAIHGLMNILFPHYLKPIPSLSIIEFYPKPSLKEKLNIPKNTIINSVPIDDVECCFATTSDFNIYPIKIDNITYEEQNNDKSSLTLNMQLLDTNLATIKLEELEFYLGDSYNNASNLFMLFNNYLHKITIEVDQKIISLSKKSLVCRGFDKTSPPFAYPKNAFSSYPILQEYFVLPQKFFFFRLNELDTLKNYPDAKKFKIVFHFKDSPIFLDISPSDTIKLFCTPAKNLFEDESEPIVLTHERELLHVRPPLRYKDKYQVYDVLKVSGYIQNQTQQKKYFPFESFEKNDQEKNIYQVHRKISIVNSQEEVYLSLHYNQNIPTERETLSVKISCTNGQVPERLQIGEISKSSDNSPELATFKNITPCTMQIDSPINEESLWQFISHLSINLLTLADIKTFKEMLKLYMFPNNRDKSKVAKNQKRIDAIEEFNIDAIDKVSRGYMLKGHKITIGIRQDHFASLGDLYLFCSVILEFLSSYATLNTFVELEVKEKITGESLVWEPILGNKKLI